MRILFVCSNIPSVYKPRTLGFIRALVAAGHRVSLLCFPDRSLGHPSMRPDITELQTLTDSLDFVDCKQPFLSLAQASAHLAFGRSTSEDVAYANSSAVKASRRIIEAGSYDVVHVDRYRTYGSLPSLDVPSVVDLTDLRSAAISSTLVKGVGSPLSVSAVDIARAIVDRRGARAQERTLRNSHAAVASEIRGCVDSDRWVTIPNVVRRSERLPSNGNPVGRELHLAISGNLKYPPVTRGVLKFAKEVAPGLKQHFGTINLTVVGRAPSARVGRYLRACGFMLKFDVLNVPTELSGADVAVGPELYSNGFPNRVLDAVYRAGVPFIGSDEGCRGLPADIRAEIPTYDDTHSLIQEIERITDRRSMISNDIDRTRDIIESHCLDLSVASKLVELYESAIRVN